MGEKGRSKVSENFQRCVVCNGYADRWEEDYFYIGEHGPLCEACFDESIRMSNIAAAKEAQSRLAPDPRDETIAALRNAICDLREKYELFVSTAHDENVRTENTIAALRAELTEQKTINAGALEMMYELGRLGDKAVADLAAANSIGENYKRAYRLIYATLWGEHPNEFEKPITQTCEEVERLRAAEALGVRLMGMIEGATKISTGAIRFDLGKEFLYRTDLGPLPWVIRKKSSGNLIAYGKTFAAALSAFDAAQSPQQGAARKLTSSLSSNLSTFDATVAHNT